MELDQDETNFYFSFRKDDKAVIVAVILQFKDESRETVTDRKYIYYHEGDPSGVSGAFHKYKLSQEDKNKFKCIVPIWFLSKNQRVCANITGASGSGKSCLLARMIKEFLKVYPKKYERNYLFTHAVEDDPAFKQLKLKLPRVDIEDAMENATLEDVRDSIVVYDDAGASPDKNKDKWLQMFMLQILERSRKLNCSFINVNHDTRNFMKTKLLNLECNNYTIFPQSNWTSSEKILRLYLGFSKQQTENMRKIKNGRFTFLYISKLIPYYISNDRIETY